MVLQSRQFLHRNLPPGDRCDTKRPDAPELIPGECLLSLAPGFSRVMAIEVGLSRFNGLVFGRLRKRLKPFPHSAPISPG
jgi:hypothetical protein